MPVPQVAVGAAATLSSVAILFGSNRLLQCGHAHFDILDLNGLGGVIQHAVGSTHAGGMRRGGVHHDLEQRRNGGARCLLEPCD